MHTFVVNRIFRNLVRRALREDLGVRGDITSQATIPAGHKSTAVIVAKASGIVAGQPVAQEVFRTLDKKLQYESVVPDSQRVETGQTIAELRGSTRSILAGERSALNILGRMSGIATLTGQFVEAVAGSGIKISETRKTAPGLRYLDKAAVRIGGGVNHRYALYDAFLIKENHIAAAGDIVKAIHACQDFRIGKTKRRFKVMVEVRNLEEFRLAQSAHPDRIMLDNFTSEGIVECLKYRLDGVEIEASGGINLQNISEFVKTCVNYISLGMLTHSVKNLDLSLLIQSNKG